MLVNLQRILVVDDDPACVQILGRILAPVGQVRFAMNGFDALAQARAWRPDILLLDAELPGVSGFNLCKQIKADELLSDIPVVFVTSHSGPGYEVSGFQVGASDFIAKPVNPKLVLARVRAQLRTKAMADELRRISALDPLTGVGNRRAFDHALAREWRRSCRAKSPLALLMVDVDHFKQFNDLYGHLAGDECLQKIAQALHAAARRPADSVCRYGGEEFAVLLPDTAPDGAERVAAEVLRSIWSLAVPHLASPMAATVTASVGIGSFDGMSEADPGMLVQTADAALYDAKRAGRARASGRSVAGTAG